MEKKPQIREGGRLEDGAGRDGVPEQLGAPGARFDDVAGDPACDCKLGNEKSYDHHVTTAHIMDVESIYDHLKSRAGTAAPEDKQAALDIPKK